MGASNCTIRSLSTTINDRQLILLFFYHIHMCSRLFLLGLSRGNEPSFNIHQFKIETRTNRSDKNLFQMETSERTE